MTDHLDYDQLLERGRELLAMLEAKHPDQHLSIYIALALLDRHLEQRVRELEEESEEGMDQALHRVLTRYAAEGRELADG